MKKNLFKRCLFIAVLIILLMIVISIIIRYDVEGEKRLPFSVAKILLVSTVDGNVMDDPNNIWNIGITQVNDVYMYINQTIKDDDTTIKEIKFENFIIKKEPQKGTIRLLRPTGELSNLYTYSQQDYLNESITYLGGAIDDMKSLEIGNKGGVLGFRFSLEDLGTFISNENQEITYDGKLLSNLGVNLEEIQFDVSFDIILTTSNNISYKGNISLSLPIDNVIEEGSSSKEITDFSNVIFKRIQK